MAKEGYFGIACGVGAIIMAILQRMLPKMPPYVGWSLIGLLSLLCIFLIIKGTLLKVRNPVETPKPIFFIRSSGFSRLAKDYTQQFQRFLVWYEVTISNPSPNLRLGIQRIVLTWEKAKDERRINAFTPVLGDIDIREDEIAPSIKGEIGSSFNLEPNEVKAGKLVFIAEGNRFLAMGQYNTEIIKLTDNHSRTFTYKAKVDDILS